MARFDYAGAIALLENARRVAVCGHINPDGDCVGSALGLALALRERGIEATPLVAAHALPASLDFLPGFELLELASEYRGHADVFIAVDVPSADRLGDGIPLFTAAPKTIVFDHHEGPASFATESYGDPTAAAAALLVWEFAQQLGVEHAPGIATCCYTALVTDTGRFQFQNTDARALRAAAELVEAGANASDICLNLFQRKPLTTLELETLTVQRARFMCGGRAVLSWIDDDDLARLGATREDAEDLIDTIRQLEGVEVAVMLKGQAGGHIRGSLRSKSELDVAAVARKMSGGGHKAAAGFSLTGAIEPALDTVGGHLAELFNCTYAGWEDAATLMARRAGEGTR